ncbi:MAG: Hpt domain-containing protein [Gammaproteobacteria bacterium]|nr:Hpt domain-containing protein [Gammaproteobacteria bacterium]
MGEQLDYTTLTWVKDEIQESLNQTHQALEAFIEDPTDTTQIRFCATYLHQVYGTLQMVEIYGAALLAEEMEKLANALLNNQIAQKDDAFDVLIRATLQLPSYLESLERGQPDMPVVLTPLLNDMRAARGEPLLSENAFFSPDLTVAPPEKRLPADKDYPEMQGFARKLRPIYQLSLLGVLRDKDSAGSLKKMAAVLRELQNASEDDTCQRLWWVTGGIVEALIDEGLGKSTALKMLMGQVDREIKRVVDGGEQAIVEKPPTDLIKNCLYYAGTSTSNGPRVSTLKQAFNLEQLLPFGGALEQAMDNLKGSTSDIMGNVSGVIKDDLLQIKDQLDIFVRNPKREVSSLAPLADSLRRTADTLAMLGLGDLRKVIQDQATQLKQFVEAEQDPADDALMETASALLYVESSLDNLQTIQRAHSEEDAPDLTMQGAEDSRVLLPQSEQTQIANLVIKEAKEVLADVKEGFNAFAVEPGQFEAIKDAPAKLAQIQGALAVMNLTRASRLLGAANAYIREDVIAAQTKPNPEQLDTLADAITSIEYYLEAIREGRGQPEGVLAVAEISVEQLGHPVESVSDIINVDTLAEAETEIERLEPEAELPLDDALDDEIANIESSVETAAVETDSLVDDSDIAAADKTQEIVFEQATITPEDSVADLAMPAAEPEQYQDEDIDEEILEIFVEEADEVLVTMTDCLHAWRANNDDSKSLETLRRSYHTIKGSGRLAGAMVMGDFAWSIENLLNRVLDNKIAASPAMFTLLDNAESVVRGLLAHLKKETEARPPVKALAAQADAMADGASFSVSDIASVAVVTGPAAAAPDLPDASDSDDSALTDILSDTTAPLEDAAAEDDAFLLDEPLSLEDDLSLEGTVLADDAFMVEDALVDEDSLSLEDSLSVEDSLSAEDALADEDPFSSEEALAVEDPFSIDEDVSWADDAAVDALSSAGDSAQIDAELVDNAIDELEAISLELSMEAEDESEAAPGSAADQAPAYESTLVDVFRKEAATHIGAIREFLLNANNETTGVTDELHRAFHTLHGSARMANVASISELSEPADRLIRAMHGHGISIDSDGQALLYDLTQVIETLVADFDRDDFVAPDNSALLSRLAAYHDAVLASAATTPVPAEPQAPVSASSDEDAELLEVFVEEADEILGHSDALMQQWRSADAGDTSAIVEIQRALHTLKGGARLANFAAIGDLTHALESVLEAVTEGRRATVDQLPALVQQGLDWLANAIQQVRTGEPVTAADDLLAQIAAITTGAGTAEPADDELEMFSISTTDSAADDLQALDAPTQGLSDDTPVVSEELEQTEPTASLPGEDEFEELTETEQPRSTRIPEPEAVAAADVDYDPDLLEIFLEEAEEIQENTERALQAWATQLDNLEHIAELQRLLHTLKGGARMANVSAVGDLAHAMESLLERITDGRTPPAAQHPALIQTCHDWLVGALEQARKLQPTSVPTELIAQLEAAIRGEQYTPATPAVTAAPEPASTPAAVKPEPVPEAAEIAAEAIDPADMEELATSFSLDTADLHKAEQKAAAGSDEQVRVRADLLNNLVNFSGEINIYNSRIAQQLGASRFNLAELDQTVQRLHGQLRSFEIETETQIMYRHETTVSDTEDFDPLEMDRFSTMQQLSRSMVESLGDLTNIQSILENHASETDILLLQQQRVTSDLQEGLMRTRMVSFSSILPRLRRILRQTCKEVGKEAELLVTGGEGELDRTQLNRIVPALEHILRNAIGHGLELPQIREQAGKPASGNVHIVFAHQGSEVVLTISDDGAGINIDALRNKAIEKGRMLADADLSDREIIEFILETGFSTAAEVTQISGRGVGMDVVNTEVKQLGGTLHIESEAGKGTRFILRLPLTVLVNQALMIQVADATYAIQLPNIEHVVRVGTAELEPMVSGENPFYEYAGNQYQYLNLGTVLHGAAPILPQQRQRVPLMLIRSADHRVALHVDNLLGRQEIVIKSVGPQLSTVNVLSGATILPDGQVALILDVGNLVRSALAQRHGKASPLLPTIDESAAAENKMPTVMIVDDSITVRKVTERLLKRYEYNIITAKDGVDALTVMIEQIPDIMLLDVEMPRMDGYELATTMRNDTRLNNVPIIMITSRTGDKHRQRALDIGVNMYMGKPYQEHELIENIRALTGVKQA